MNWLSALLGLVVSLASLAHCAGAALGLSVGSEGQLLLEGRRYRGVGVNYYDLFVRQIPDPTDRTAQLGMEQLASFKIPFVRFSAGGYWPHDWRLYQTNRAEYFARLDSVVRTAERLGIGLIPSLFWHYSTVPDLVGEPVSAWGRTNSQTHSFMREYTRQTVTRYQSSRAIWAWEFGNEYNLPADLPNAAEHRAPVVPALGTPSFRSPADDLSHAMIRVAVREFAAEVRRHDAHRMIVSGHAFPRTSAWHQAAEGSWRPDSPEQFALVIAADNPLPVDSLCVRAYDLTNDVGRIPLAMQASRDLKKPLFVGEFGVPGPDTKQARKVFASLLGNIETGGVPLAALWVYDFQAQANEWSVTLSNARGWQLEEIRAVNQRIGNAKSSH
ncbi:MAG: cellulase family glycosylhydrolase [Verrucomicrobiales bacterium]|nr:cellulase family glycosylhydrolase [Verrucomicrobiales bacterium]